MNDSTNYNPLSIPPHYLLTLGLKGYTPVHIPFLMALKKHAKMTNKVSLSNSKVLSKIISAMQSTGFWADDVLWTRKSMKKLHAMLPDMSIGTIRKYVKMLVDMGILIKTRDYNFYSTDQVYAFTVDVDKLSEIGGVVISDEYRQCWERYKAKLGQDDFKPNTVIKRLENKHTKKPLNHIAFEPHLVNPIIDHTLLNHFQDEGLGANELLIYSTIAELCSRTKFIRDGLPYTKLSAKDLKATYLPFLSVSEVSKALRNLVDIGLLFGEMLHIEYSDNTLSYTLNMDAIGKFHNVKPTKRFKRMWGQYLKCKADKEAKERGESLPAQGDEVPTNESHIFTNGKGENINDTPPHIFDNHVDNVNADSLKVYSEESERVKNHDVENTTKPCKESHAGETAEKITSTFSFSNFDLLLKQALQDVGRELAFQSDKQRQSLNDVAKRFKSIADFEYVVAAALRKDATMTIGQMTHYMRICLKNGVTQKQPMATKKQSWDNGKVQPTVEKKVSWFNRHGIDCVEREGEVKLKSSNDEEWLDDINW